MAITDWPATERPREKLLAQGVTTLSDAELLAIFLRVGLPGKTAVDLARELLQHFQSLNGIFSASLPQIQSVHGMGTSKYCQLQAVLEMSRRALAETLQHSECYRSPAQVKQYLQLQLGHLQREVFGIMFLDTQHRLITYEILFEGSLLQTSVYPREVIKRGLALNAAAVILSHNHPGGIAEPSRADHALTRSLKQALEMVDIKVLDHIIVARQETYSFSEQGQC